MDLAILFATGFAFGFVGSMPVAGPVSILVVSLVLEGRAGRAIGVAVGAAVAEAIYAALAFFGFSTLLARYEIVGPISRIVAAVILFGIGIALLLRKPAGDTASTGPTPRPAPGTGPLLGFTICALNPTLIATWSATVTTLFSTRLFEFTPAAAPLFGAGVCVGIVAWFGILVFAGGKLVERLEASTLDRLLRSMGFVALGAGVAFAIWAASTFPG